MQFIVKKVEDEEEEKVFRVWDYTIHFEISAPHGKCTALEATICLYSGKYAIWDTASVSPSPCLITHWSGQHIALEEVKWERLTDQIPFRPPNSLEA